MTQPKDGESFFRKVARFVANPTTDWAEINSRQDDPEADMAKAELRAMVERKRRNDFVRKRELDMLRRIRREGLTPEQLAALGSASSRLDDVDGRPSEPPGNKIDPRVKDKINEIEQQMVGESYAPTQMAQPPSHPPNFFETSTRPVHFATTQVSEPASPPPSIQFPQSTRQPASQSPSHAQSTPAPARVSEFSTAEEMERLAMPSHAAVTMGAGMSPLSDAKPSVLPSMHDLPPLEMGLGDMAGIGGITKGGGPAGAAAAASAAAAPAPVFGGLDSRPAELHEMVHDPELDEAVIAFANADYDGCEKCLTELTRPGGLRNLHGETWLVLFDLYRAIGSQAKFEALALEYAQQFGLSAPQWFSLPKLVAESVRSIRPAVARSGGSGSTACWTAPDYLDVEAVEQLATRCQNQPLPWVLDWGPVRQFDTEACKSLRQLLRGWAGQQVEMRWLGGDHLLNLLKELTPVAVRDVDPALWMLRLEVLRAVNRPDQFDEAAIDYCVTYEVSPPSWERAQCRVRVSGARGQSTSSTGGPSSSLPTETMAHSSSFLESSIIDDAPGLPPSVELELSGQLSGDISETLARLTAELGAATLVTISCPRLIRLDFMAAGDLLNWVLVRRGENRTVIFSEAHRLVALFFGAMGINEHARVKVRLV